MEGEVAAGGRAPWARCFVEKKLGASLPRVSREEGAGMLSGSPLFPAGWPRASATARANCPSGSKNTVLFQIFVFVEAAADATTNARSAEVTAKLAAAVGAVLAAMRGVSSAPVAAAVAAAVAEAAAGRAPGRGLTQR